MGGLLMEGLIAVLCYDGGFNCCIVYNGGFKCILHGQVGIGTVACGVAKAGADVIQVSGHDGGTGASPMTSMRHAGSPWELGLAESHAALRRAGLRGRVLLRADGGLKSGWDVVMAACMGAEEFGFGTAALLAQGCVMARICHTNKCDYICIKPPLSILYYVLNPFSIYYNSYSTLSQVPHGRGQPGPPPAREIHGHARGGGYLLHLRGSGG
jgi:hypothetical protein